MQNAEHTRSDAFVQCQVRFTPSIKIDIRNRTGTNSSSERYFAATITGLQALKCSDVTGYGRTEEEAVRNLRRKVLQYLDSNRAVETRTGLV
jgi:hypothetical protein